MRRRCNRPATGSRSRTTGCACSTTARAPAWACAEPACTRIRRCFETEYHYNYWRPTSAIRLADIDGNPATEADAGWTPFVPTPNHPEYPAAHGCDDGATAEVVRSFYGTKKVRFTFDSTVTGTTHVYESTDGLVHDVRNGRVWGGMHFRNSVVVGSELGKDVAKWVAKNYFRPLP
jgi:hypothetical protein